VGTPGAYCSGLPAALPAADDVIASLAGAVGAATELAVSAGELGVEVAELGTESAFDGTAPLVVDVTGSCICALMPVVAAAEVAAGPASGRLEPPVRAAFRDGVFTALPSSAPCFDVGAALRLGAGATELPASAMVTALSRVASVTGAGCTAARGALISVSLRE
jgi:hypothetical protein